MNLKKQGEYLTKCFLVCMGTQDHQRMTEEANVCKGWVRILMGSTQNSAEYQRVQDTDSIPKDLIWNSRKDVF